MNKPKFSKTVLKMAKKKLEEGRIETEKRILERLYWERKFDWI